MNRPLYIECPYCLRKVRVRKDNCAQKHYINVPNTNNMGICITPGRKVPCKGSEVHILFHEDKQP